MTIQMNAIEQYFHVVLFVFDNFAKRNSIFFLSFELGTRDKAKLTFKLWSGINNNHSELLSGIVRIF